MNPSFYGVRTVTSFNHPTYGFVHTSSRPQRQLFGQAAWSRLATKRGQVYRPSMITGRSWFQMNATKTSSCLMFGPANISKHWNEPQAVQNPYEKMGSLQPSSICKLFPLCGLGPASFWRSMSLHLTSSWILLKMISQGQFTIGTFLSACPARDWQCQDPLVSSICSLLKILKGFKDSFHENWPLAPIEKPNFEDCTNMYRAGFWTCIGWGWMVLTSFR